MKRAFIFLPLSILLSSACNNNSQTVSNINKVSSFEQDDKQFAEYWYSGNAEIATYTLEQSRYGELRQGTASLIFVTEPFSIDKQVKLDFPEKNQGDKLTVMKLNFTKKFVTGIYPYSMMLSTFTPVDQYNHPNTVKTTMSSQEWCGQTYLQLNLQRNNYEIRAFSYFESEGDQKKKIGKVVLEDELWNRIRLNPAALPKGSFKMLPGAFYLRLDHKNLNPVEAKATLQEMDSTNVYTVKHDNRELEIHFRNTFPYKIQSWKESVGDQVTTGKLMKTLHTDYWNKNAQKYTYLRDTLNLP